jgi:hypothetical protein
MAVQGRRLAAGLADARFARKAVILLAETLLLHPQATVRTRVE